MSDSSSPTGAGQQLGAVHLADSRAGEEDHEERDGAPSDLEVEVASTDGRVVRVLALDDRHPQGRDALHVGLTRWAQLAANSALALEQLGELQLVFVGVDTMAELNRDYMGIDRPTDVLSFPMDGLEPSNSNDAMVARDEVMEDGDTVEGPTRLLGDIIVCPEIAHQNAPTHAGTFDDELALLVVHGVLHLLGYDHAEPDDAATMRGREAELLKRFHWDGPAPPGFRHEHLDQ